MVDVDCNSEIEPSIPGREILRDFMFCVFVLYIFVLYYNEIIAK